jgi:SP family myo-inositol transporter-like MFS transporter 13
MFPEGLSIDEAFSLFEDDFGVKNSKQMRKEKIELQKTLNETGTTSTLPSQVVEKTKDDVMLHVEDHSPKA